MKITITARNFSAGDNAAVKYLISKGYEINDLSGENFSTGTPEEVIADAVDNADAVIAGLEPIGEKVFSKNPNLKIVSKRSIGYDTLVKPAADTASPPPEPQALLRVRWRSTLWLLYCILHGIYIPRMLQCTEENGCGP